MRLSLFESRKFHDGLNATIAERLGFMVSPTTVAISRISGEPLHQGRTCDWDYVQALLYSTGYIK
jgi:hypothetical protein